MAAFLQLDISSEYPAMCKFILSAEGNYEVRFILIVVQSRKQNVFMIPASKQKIYAIIVA